MPVCNLGLAVQPAQLDDLAVAVAREVEQPAYGILHPDAEILERVQRVAETRGRLGEIALRQSLLGIRAAATRVGDAPCERLHDLAGDSGGACGVSHLRDQRLYLDEQRVRLARR